MAHVPYRAYSAVARETGTMRLAHKTLRERISDSYLRPTCRACAATSMRVIMLVGSSGRVGAAQIYSLAPPASRGGLAFFHENILILFVFDFVSATVPVAIFKRLSRYLRALENLCLFSLCLQTVVTGPSNWAALAGPLTVCVFSLCQLRAGGAEDRLRGATERL